MKKVWTIAWKDTLGRLRDRNALVLTLLAPLLVAAIMGAALGGEPPRAARPGDAPAQQAAAREASAGGAAASSVELRSAPAHDAPVNRSPLAFFAPSLAIFFLTISMFEAPRSILVEQEEGTLGRLMRTPTSSGQILLGKLGGSYLTGLLQFAVLVAASRLLFGLTWGPSLGGLALMVVAVVVASASMGAVIAALSKTVMQAGALGGGIALLSAGLGGNFFAAADLPSWLQILSRLTVNRWALEGFTKLTVRNLGIHDVLPNAAVLFVIAAALFALAFWKFQRRFAG